MTNLKNACKTCAAVLCLLIFLGGFLVPSIYFAFDRKVPYKISNIKVGDGKPGEVVKITADFQESIPGRECSIVTNPQVLGTAGDLAFANQTRLISGVLIQQMLAQANGKFLSAMQVPPTISSGDDTLVIDMDMRCTDNYMHRLFPIQQTLVVPWRVLPK